MSQLEFDAQTSKLIEAAYAGRDMVNRRELVREALAVRPGDRVLDVGCGPGFYATELVESVGPDGAIVGVDSSESMLALANARGGGHENVEFELGEATALPVADGSFDAALSVQVLEYVPEIPAALAEIRRALRPGGRVVLWDVDWTTLSMSSAKPERMRTVLDAWDEHLTHVALPRTLTAQLREAGFDDVTMDGYAFATDQLVPDTYGGFLVPFVERFVIDREAVAEEEAHAWADEQRELAARGEFYAAVIQFRFAATAPDAGRR
jgi:ubiquinone/menaquinone biosynthesis C-methylase UbiE